MTGLPTPVRTRKTVGSQRVAEYTARNNVRPVSWYVMPDLHAAVVAIAQRRDLTLQLLLTHACEVRYGQPDAVVLPPLVPPTRIKTDPHKSVTWYCPEPLFKSLKRLSVDIEASVQQLITSAVVDQLKDTPEVKVLRINTGVAPYMRAPVAGEISFQKPPLRRVR